MNNPLVSIIVPCYNQAQFLGEALQSVLDQTYENWECIIVNDGSSDNVEEVSIKWIENDSRFKYFHKENAGVSSARNLGISHALGEFILPLDADDKISRDYIDLAIIAFQEDSLLKVVYCKAEKFGDDTGLWRLGTYSLLNLCRYNMIFCSALFRKKEWELVGGYDVKMIHGIEDWEFWIAVLKNGGEVRCLDIIGFYYRIKQVSRQKQFNDKSEREMLNYMSIKHVDFYVKQLGSFSQLYNVLEETKKEYLKNLKSKKFIINLFCKNFFAFKIFNENK
jgi:glycosyltransferase involved in cell wall biosynthesis